MLRGKTFAAMPVAIVLAVTGCSTKPAAPAASSSSAPAPSSSNAPGTSAPSSSNVPQTPAPATAPASSTAAVIATADGENEGIKAEILALKRDSGGTVTLRFVLVNNSQKDLGFGYDFGDQANFNIGDFASIGGVNLVDTVNQKKYLVARDSQNHCLCSRDLSGIAPGSRKTVYAQFPAPPDDVQKINVVIPHFLPANDVPLSR